MASMMSKVPGLVLVAEKHESVRIVRSQDYKESYQGEWSPVCCVCCVGCGIESGCIIGCRYTLLYTHRQPRKTKGLLIDNALGYTQCYCAQVTTDNGVNTMNQLKPL